MAMNLVKMGTTLEKYGIVKSLTTQFNIFIIILVQYTHILVSIGLNKVYLYKYSLQVHSLPNSTTKVV